MYKGVLDLVIQLLWEPGEVRLGHGKKVGQTAGSKGGGTGPGFGESLIILSVEFKMVINNINSSQIQRSLSK